jgi:hypothetical protein
MLARSCFASGKLNPRSAISPIPSGRQISIRSVLGQRASSPIAINRNTLPFASPFPRSAIDPTDRTPVSSYPHSLDTPPSQADIHTGGRIVEQQDYPHCTCPGPAVAYSPSLSWRLGPPGSQAPATPPNTVAPFVLVPLPSAWPPCSRGRRWCPPAVPTTRAALLRNPAPQSRSVARRNRSAVRSHDGRQSSD